MKLFQYRVGVSIHVLRVVWVNACGGMKILVMVSCQFESLLAAFFTGAGENHATYALFDRSVNDITAVFVERIVRQIQTDIDQRWSFFIHMKNGLPNLSTASFFRGGLMLPGRPELGVRKRRHPQKTVLLLEVVPGVRFRPDRDSRW